MMALSGVVRLTCMSWTQITICAAAHTFDRVSWHVSGGIGCRLNGLSDSGRMAERRDRTHEKVARSRGDFFIWQTKSPIVERTVRIQTSRRWANIAFRPLRWRKRERWTQFESFDNFLKFKFGLCQACLIGFNERVDRMRGFTNK